MRPIAGIAASLFAAAAVPAMAVAATIGGVDYATQYDYREFHNAADGKAFRVVLEGLAFPSADAKQTANGLLRQMHANRPPPRLTFTYDVPPEKPRPDYRLVLVFDTANDLGADSVCATGKVRHRAATPGRLHVFAIYCRNDLALSQTTAWTAASGADDPRVGVLFRDLFRTVFSDASGINTRAGHFNR